MGIISNMVQNVVTIYGLLFLYWVLSSPSRLLHRRALFPLHIRIDPQTQRQMLSGVQLHQRLQNLGVHMFRRLVRPNILSSENISCAKRAAPEFVCSIRLRRHIRALTHSQFRNIAFVNVQPYAQNGIARHHNHRRIELCRDAPPVVPQLPQNHTIDRRTDITLLEVRAPPQAVPAPWLPPPPRERDPLVNSSLFRVQSRRFESFAYLFTAIACSSKCPPRSSAPAPINSRAGKSVVVK